MQKSVNLVDLVKCFHTSIYLEKSASIQPRTSLSEFGDDFIHLFIRLLRSDRSDRLGSGAGDHRPGRLAYQFPSAALQRESSPRPQVSSRGTLCGEDSPAHWNRVERAARRSLRIRSGSSVYVAQ